MINGKTQLGFEFSVEESVMDDWEILEGLRKVDKGNVQVIVDVAEQLLGEEQYERLKKYVKKHCGRVKTTVMTTEIASIFEAIKEGKN